MTIATTYAGPSAPPLALREAVDFYVESGPAVMNRLEILNWHETITTRLRHRVAGAALLASKHADRWA